MQYIPKKTCIVPDIKLYVTDNLVSCVNLTMRATISKCSQVKQTLYFRYYIK